MLWTDKVKKILLKYWKFDKLKDKQISVINEILAGNDVVGLLPTGYGKSLCYLLPPLLTKKTIFIISPLISLMDDQKEKLLKMGIPVSALHCNNSNKEKEMNEIIEGKIKIVYMSPEFLAEGHGLKLATLLFSNNLLGYLAVDESHCLSCWGHDFRPQYLKLVDFRKLFPTIPIMAVTATAKETVVKEIISFLQLKEPKVIRANFDRPNLFIECKVVEKHHRKNMHGLIKEYIDKYPDDRIIVYVNSRKDTEEYSEALNKLYINNISSPYHAGLTKKNREKIQSDFINNNCKIIISTIAFGMGIDQIVKCVLIIGCPASIEEYYQQIGRGGRDGLDCETVFYYDKSKKIAKEYILKKEQNSYYKIENIRKVDDYFYTKKCRRQFILDYLGLSKSYFAYNQFTCKKCDNCTKYKLIDITNYVITDKVNPKIENIIDEFKLNKILRDWRKFIEFKNYTLENIPDGMKIKLRLNNFDLSEYDLIYDKYDNIKFL